MNLEQLIISFLGHFHNHIIAYLIALFSALLETVIGIGWIFPGSTIILLMGALAAKGYFDLGDLIIFAIIGATIGDNINYSIGKKYGKSILKNGLWFIKASHFKKGEKFFKKYGSLSVFIGRFIPSLKETIPFIVGIFGMKRFSFMFWNILGAIGWGLSWILPGYFFAQSLEIAKRWQTRTGFFITIVIVSLIIIYILKIIIVKNGKNFISLLLSMWKSTKEAIIENPLIEKFTTKHKTFFSFLQKRLDNNNFYGLPLTLLSLSLLYLLSLLGGIIEDIISSQSIVYIDVKIENLLAIFRNSELIKFFSWITIFGIWQIVTIFVIATIIILWILKKQKYILPLLLSIFGSETFTFIGKEVFHRARPTVALYKVNSFSFPSGHATIAVSFYGFLTYMMIRETKKWKNKINILFLGFILITLIGFSRLYLGVHYLSDVLGGYLVGGIWLIIGISITEYLSFKKGDIKRKRIKKINRDKSFYKKLVTVGIIFISLTTYILFCFNYTFPLKAQHQSINTISQDKILDILQNKQLLYTETLLGNKKEPLDLIIFTKNNTNLIKLFRAAKWNLTDNLNFLNVYNMVKSALFRETYTKAPAAPIFWNSKVQNFSFEKEIMKNKTQGRYLIRIWKTNYITKNGDFIYVGTISLENNTINELTDEYNFNNENVEEEKNFLIKTFKIANLSYNSKEKQVIYYNINDSFIKQNSQSNPLLFLFVK